MDHLQQLLRQIRWRIFAMLLLENVVLIGLLYLVDRHSGLAWYVAPLVGLVFAAAATILLTGGLTELTLEPTKALWQAILHIAPGNHGVAAPKVNQLRVGRELVTALTSQIYELAGQVEHPAASAEEQPHDDQARFVLQNLPLPLFLVASDQTVRFANDTAAKYLGLEMKDVIGNNIYSLMDMSFPSDNTLDAWLGGVRGKSATATGYWERVRLFVNDTRPTRLFDLAAYYNQGNSAGLETMLVLFDHTEQYSQDDQAVSFMALAVHELRTPLTLLRGYIEVFEDELGNNLNTELSDFMHKMHASAEQLTVFVNNILNVARVDDDQLMLQLHEESWAGILKHAVDTMSLRASVRGIVLECSVADDLPGVAVDRVSIQEVIDNLIDNAIKYSGESKKIEIKSQLNSEGLVETTVQDWGMGIPQSIVPNLFSKFYRDHRNRAQIGGTGLGLYLSKAIVTAHGGNIWVRTKEGQGSTFGFSIVPYAQLAEERKKAGNKDITRSAHGWIKNHSLYRR